MSTGKEQSIQITSSSGLSSEEIERLIKDAELHADDDRRRKELVDAKNAADALIYSTEKTLAEMGDKADHGIRAEIEASVNSLKEVVKSDDTQVIVQRTDSLNQAAHKLAQNMYQQPGAGGCSGGGCGTDAGHHQGSAPPDDDVVDAEFQEVA